MADAPNRNSSRRRPSHSQGAQSRSKSARPLLSASPQTETHPASPPTGEGTPSPPPRAPRDGARTSFPDDVSLRRFARMLMHRGERATREGDYPEGAMQFERAAWAYEYLSDPLAAAEAALELGRCLIYLNHGDLLRALAGRIENLAKEGAASLPEGGLITMRVWAAILRRGQIEPGPFLHLIRLRRRARRADAPQAPRPMTGGLPLIDFIPPLSLIPPPGLSASRDDSWTLSPDSRWLVYEIDVPSSVARIELGRRVIDLGRLLDCPARWQIEKKRVVVKVAADRRGYALINALREEGWRDQETAS